MIFKIRLRLRNSKNLENKSKKSFKMQKMKKSKEETENNNKFVMKRSSKMKDNLTKKESLNNLSINNL